MAKLGKRAKAMLEGLDLKALYTIDDAVKILKERSKVKFDETVEVSINLGVDPRHADQMVRGVIGLPNGTGKSVRVAVLARGDNAEKAKAAGESLLVQKILWKPSKKVRWILIAVLRHRT